MDSVFGIHESETWLPLRMPLLSQICQDAPTALKYPESAPCSPILSHQNWIATTVILSPFFLFEIFLTVELLHFDPAHS